MGARAPRRHRGQRGVAGVRALLRAGARGRRVRRACDRTTSGTGEAGAPARGDGPGVTLAFCDLRVVDATGTVLSPTYWRGRRPGWDDLGELLATNVVTGAACLVRRDVLDVALPFPRELDDCFHDHWLACCALALAAARRARALVDTSSTGERDRWSQAPRARRRRRGGGPGRPATASATSSARRCGPARSWSACRACAAKRAALERAADPSLRHVLSDALREQRDATRTLQARRRALRGFVLGRQARRGGGGRGAFIRLACAARNRAPLLQTSGAVLCAPTARAVLRVAVRR